MSVFRANNANNYFDYYFIDAISMYISIEWINEHNIIVMFSIYKLFGRFIDGVE